MSTGGVEENLVRPKTSAAGNVFGCLLQAVDSAPCFNGATPVRDAFSCGEVRRTFGTHHPTHRHHFALVHVLLPNGKLTGAQVFAHVVERMMSLAANEEGGEMVGSFAGILLRRSTLETGTCPDFVC